VDEDRWKSLEIWKKADELAFLTYKLTRDFPKEELYGLTSQLKRAALSIPTNIVEGYARKGDKELGRFLGISLGSLAETKYLVHFAEKLGYLKGQQLTEIQNSCEVLGKQLWKFYEKVR
jgi:four helix bundle protein